MKRLIVNTLFLETAFEKWRRSISEQSEDVKLIFLLSGIEALYNKKDIKNIPEIVDFYNESLSKKSEKIIGQSYWRRNQVVHGKTTDLGHIQKLVPQLQQILQTLLIHQISLRNSTEFSEIISIMDQEVVL